jgi:two-component system OmpR family sensor kinase
MGALPKKKDIAQAMDRIEKEAIRMGVLVEDLLALARLDESRPLEITDVNLVSLANDAAMDARAVDPDRVITVVADDSVDASSGLHIQASEDKIRQVMTNLLGNALRFTPADSPLEIRLATSEEAIPASATISIVDHGDGIPPQIRKKIFERFWRADSSRTRETGGSGLGLAIVASIVTAHHGSIDVTETPDGGATFSVSLPVIHTAEA